MIVTCSFRSVVFNLTGSGALQGGHKINLRGHELKVINEVGEKKSKVQLQTSVFTL